MMNQVIIVGRIVKIESAEKTVVTIACTRPFKNTNGEYETDFLPIVLWGGVSETAVEYCKQGDIIGIWSQHMQYKEIYCILPLIYM